MKTCQHCKGEIIRNKSDSESRWAIRKYCGIKCSVTVIKQRDWDRRMGKTKKKVS